MDPNHTCMLGQIGQKECPLAVLQDFRRLFMCHEVRKVESRLTSSIMWALSEEPPSGPAMVPASRPPSLSSNLGTAWAAEVTLKQVDGNLVGGLTWVNFGLDVEGHASEDKKVIFRGTPPPTFYPYPDSGWSIRLRVSY